ncbi:hypothetical protein [Stappia sp. TSB10P1A]|nr:hypothetical protein [Stappia sp. TSB10P1A]
MNGSENAKGATGIGAVVGAAVRRERLRTGLSARLQNHCKNRKETC